MHLKEGKEGNVLFNNALNTFLIQIYDVGMVHLNNNVFRETNRKSTPTYASLVRFLSMLGLGDALGFELGEAAGCWACIPAGLVYTLLATAAME